MAAARESASHGKAVTPIHIDSANPKAYRQYPFRSFSSFCWTDSLFLCAKCKAAKVKRTRAAYPAPNLKLVHVALVNSALTDPPDVHGGQVAPISQLSRRLWQKEL